MSLCDKCIHRDVCGNEDAREDAVKVCSDFIDKSVLSVPEREKGEWEFKDIPNTTINGYWCNKCHIGSDRPHAFCPNCGADMRGGKE